MRTTPYPDLFSMESAFNAEQAQVQGLVRDWVTKEAQPKIRMAYREERFPEELIPGMGKLGLFGPTLNGWDNLSYGLMMRELERCDSGLRSCASVQGSLVMYPIHAFGSEAQKKEWLPKLTSGEVLGCFGLTESEGGSDPGAMKTRAVFENGQWRLNGSKMWITNGNVAKVAVVWAQTEKGIRGFLVPTGAKGFRATKMEGKLSLRASVTSELYFDDVILPESAILEKSEGLKSALMCLNQARYGIAWGVLGAAEACFDTAAAFAKERKVFGKSIAHFQLVQAKLARMASEITRGQLLAFRLAQLKDDETLHFGQVSVAKQANVEMALKVAREARDILGANGIMDEYPVMRHLCNLETVNTYEGTSDIHLLVVGKEITGVPAFS